MASFADSPIPLLYRLVFTYVDPMFCVMGLQMHLFDPIQTLTGYSLSFNGSPTVEAVHLLDSMAGFFAMLAVIEGVLLRIRGNDVAVWRTVQGAVFLLDAFMVWGAIRALSTDGRLDYSEWRGDDWRLVAGNTGMGVLRLMCALGIGFEEQEKTKAQ